MGSDYNLFLFFFGNKLELFSMKLSYYLVNGLRF